MSSEIFYDIKAVRIPANAVNAAEDVYVLYAFSGFFQHRTPTAASESGSGALHSSARSMM